MAVMVDTVAVMEVSATDLDMAAMVESATDPDTVDTAADTEDMVDALTVHTLLILYN